METTMVFSDECEEIIYYFENTCESRRLLRAPILKKLKEFVGQGHMPCRGDEDYKDFGCHINCFGHIFGLSNAQLGTLGLDAFKYSLLNPFGGCDERSTDKAKQEMMDFIEQAGLLVEEEKIAKVLKSNQYRVALYFSEGFINGNGRKDYHWLRQRRDGAWEGKRGADSDIVDKFDSLPKSLPFDCSNKYILDSVSVVTNPHASAGRGK